MKRNIYMINQSRNANTEREQNEVYLFLFLFYFLNIETIIDHYSISLQKKSKNELDSSKV